MGGINMRIGNWLAYRGIEICKNYGGWVIVNGYNYNIYKTLEDAKNAVRKHLDGTHKAEPRIIGRMTDEQFINALKF